MAQSVNRVDLEISIGRQSKVKMAISTARVSVLNLISQFKQVHSAFNRFVQSAQTNH